MSRIIEADLHQQWMFPPSLDEMVSNDHPVRFIWDFVEQLDLRDLSFSCPNAASAGGKAFSARLLLRVWLYGWLLRVRTHRKLERACRNDIGLLWLTGMNPPDHNTLWRFWKKNKSSLKKVFRQSVRIAADMGLVSMVFHALDGTKIRPASSPLSAWHKEDLEKLLRQTEEAIAEMEKEIASEAPEETDCRLPDQLLNQKERREEIARRLEELKRQDKKHLLPAEPEVQMIRSGGKTAFNYNAQATVDSSHGIIVAEDVVTDVLDTAQLVPMLEEAERNLAGATNESGRPAETAADGGYSNQEQLAAANGLGHEVTVPVAKRGDLHNALHSHHFQYDAGRDCLLCPVVEDQALPYVSTTKARPGHHEARIYRCPVSDSCPYREACTQNKRGREIEVTAYRESVLEQVARHGDGRMSEAMRRRLGLVEPVFGWIKTQAGFVRFSVKGLENVRAQWSLQCTVSNLSRMIRAWQKARRQARDKGLLAGPNAPNGGHLGGRQLDGKEKSAIFDHPGEKRSSRLPSAPLQRW